MTINDSPDLSTLLVRFVVDLSTPTPKLIVENQSEGQNLSAVVMAFEAYSPNGTVIYKGDIDTPDASGDFVAVELNDPVFPNFAGELEWSGNPYKFRVTARDSQGKTYTTKEQTAAICRPAGNKNVGKHYGEAKLDIDVDCSRGELRMKDTTHYSYAGKKAQDISRKTVLRYPADETGNFPAAKEFNGLSSILEYLEYSGKGFHVAISSVKRYDLGDNVTVVVRYIKAQQFDVNCNYDLCPLFSSYGKLLEKANEECDPQLNGLISQINAKMLKAVIAKMQPTCGFDLGKTIEEIKELGSFDCDCVCDRVISFGKTANGIASGINIEFDTEGDIGAEVLANQGANILVRLQDITYQFNVGGNTSDAFSFKPALNGRTKTITLNVDTKLLAEDILTTIRDTPDLLNLLRTITAASFDFIVDGKDIIQTNARCNYRLSAVEIPSNGTFVQFKSITIDGIVYSPNLSFNMNSGVDKIQTYLNGLNKGNFTVTVNAPDILLILSNQNSHLITEAKIYYPALGGQEQTLQMLYKKDGCTNSAPYSPSTIVQAIIDYIMKLTVAKTKLGSDIVFCTIDDQGKPQNINFKSTDNFENFLTALNDTMCRVVNMGGTSNNGTVSCTAVQALFSNKEDAIQPTDYLMGTRNGKCGQWPMKDLVLQMTNFIKNTNDAGIKAEWCAAVNSCSTATQPCNPISFIELTMDLLKAEDFIIVPGPCTADPNSITCKTIRYVGYYNNDVLDFDVTIRMGKKFSLTGAYGIGTADLVMPAGTNQLNDVNATLPYPGLGYSWVVQSIILPNGNNKKYLRVKWLNNGAANYGVAYRIYGSGAPLQYLTVPAQPGTNSILVFDVPENQYEAAVVANCAGGGTSEPKFGQVLGCPGASVFTVNRSGSDFRITYKFPASVLKYNLKVRYPNNGEYNEVLNVQEAGMAAQTLLAIPGGVYGDFLFEIRAVCNEAQQYFGPYSGPIVLNVPQPSAGCPQATAVEITDITSTGAKVTITPPSDTTKVVGFTVILTTTGQTPIPISQPITNLVFDFAGKLTSNKRYSVSVITNCEEGVGSTPFPGGFVFTQGPTGTFRAYWGWKDTNTVLTQAQIEASPNYADFASGADIVADFTDEAGAKYIWMACPATEPNKTSWFVSSNNQGPIGPPPLNTFTGPINVNGTINYDFYISNFKTSQTGAPIVFKS